jgi:ABC-2 type transport system permease protein
MKTLKYLLEKEFKQILRDSFMPKIIFIVPALQLLILPFAANFEMRNINIGVIDHDQSVVSHQLVNKVLSTGYFRLSNVSPTYQDGIRYVESNVADILLEIPAGFESSFATAEPKEPLIAANAVNGTKGGMGSAYLTGIIQEYLAERSPQEAVRPAPIAATYLFNDSLSYKNFMVPGIIAMLISIIGGALSALNVVREKEKGTMEQINVTPVPKALFILSKLTPFWIIGFILLSIGALISWAVYGLLPAGNLLVIYLFTAVYMIAFTGFGLAISNVSNTQVQAMFTAFFFIIVFALMSGQFTPISSMPKWAQHVAMCNPMTYFVDVMRMIYLKGAHLADLTRQFVIVCIFAVGFNALALIGYRKTEG